MSQSDHSRHSLSQSHRVMSHSQRVRVIVIVIVLVLVIIYESESLSS